MVFYLLSTASGALTGVAVLSMLADTLEYGELKFGVRLDGLGFAANSFSTKVGPAVGGLLVTLVYVIGGLDTSLVLGQEQSGGAILALRLAMFVIPNVLALVQVILSCHVSAESGKDGGSEYGTGDASQQSELCTGRCAAVEVQYRKVYRMALIIN